MVLGGYIIMKTWKIFKGMKVVSYVKVAEECKIFDDGYAALQLVRKKFNDSSIGGQQLLDVKRGEQMQESIPVFVLE